LIGRTEGSNAADAVFTLVRFFIQYLGDVIKIKYARLTSFGRGSFNMLTLFVGQITPGGFDDGGGDIDYSLTAPRGRRPGTADYGVIEETLPNEDVLQAEFTNGSEDGFVNRFTSQIPVDVIAQRLHVFPPKISTSGVQNATVIPFNIVAVFVESFVTDEAPHAGDIFGTSVERGRSAGDADGGTVS
jgi:hypothetical protein